MCGGAVIGAGSVEDELCEYIQRNTITDEVV